MTSPLEYLRDGPEGTGLTVVLAHGAGAPMDSPFMQTMARGLAERGLRVARFEFPYMRRRRLAGGGGAPDKPAVLLDTWREVARELRQAGRLVIGGKSMGGRIASMVADELAADGLVCLGYPFHPPRKPEQLRIAHLAALRTPALFVQGTRDALGSREEIRGYPLSESIRMVYLEDGDHSFEPRARGGRTHAEHMREAIDAVARFITEL